MFRKKTDRKSEARKTVQSNTVPTYELVDFEPDEEELRRQRRERSKNMSHEEFWDVYREV